MLASTCESTKDCREREVKGFLTLHPAAMQHRISFNVCSALCARRAVTRKTEARGVRNACRISSRGLFLVPSAGAPAKLQRVVCHSTRRRALLHRLRRDNGPDGLAFACNSPARGRCTNRSIFGPCKVRVHRHKHHLHACHHQIL